MSVHPGFQLFPVSYIFGNLGKTIKYSMHWFSEQLKLKIFIRIYRTNICNLQSVSEILLYLIYIYIKCLCVTLTYFISIYCYSRINVSRRRAA